MRVVKTTPVGKYNSPIISSMSRSSFTVLHVGALLIATAPVGNAAILGCVLIGIMALTAFALFVGGRDHV